jgi:hypothetical protein
MCHPRNPAYALIIDVASMTWDPFYSARTKVENSPMM